MKLIKKHKAIMSFLAGIFLGAIVTYGIMWWLTPELSTDLNTIRSFDDCSLAGFAIYQNAEDEMTCVLPNGKHFTHWLP